MLIGSLITYITDADEVAWSFIDVDELGRSFSPAILIASGVKLAECPSRSNITGRV